MLNRKIVFTAPGVTEYIEAELDENTLGADEVLVKTEFTAVSAGTERANLLGDPNLDSVNAGAKTVFPRQKGYSGSGTVLKCGSGCAWVKPGDRVIVYNGTHSQYNICKEKQLYPILDESISFEEAALFVIASFPAEGIRKTAVEFGESAIVTGLGILGLIAVQLLKAAGAAPIIAADLNPDRRRLALNIGADYALDPADPDFKAQVLALTGGAGANVAIDVAGVAAATRQALDCMARFGRIALLGCTRTPAEYDLYHLVHGKGINMIGANNNTRPQVESRPGYWTMRDDIMALQRLVKFRGLALKSLIHEIARPQDAPDVYARLIDNKNFPIGVLFDWNK